MSAPSTLPQWSTTGPITVPSSGKKAAGFVPKERPAAQYLNWLFNLIYQWIAYFRGVQTYTMVLDACDIRANAGTTISIGLGTTFVNGAATAIVFKGIPLKINERLVAVRCNVRDSATGPTPLHFAVLETTTGALGTSGTSTGAGTDQTLSVTGLTADGATKSSHYVQLSTTSGNATCTLYNIEYDVVPTP